MKQDLELADNKKTETPGAQPALLNNQPTNQSLGLPQNAGAKVPTSSMILQANAAQANASRQQTQKKDIIDDDAPAGESSLDVNN